MEIWGVVMPVMAAVVGIIWRLFADDFKAYVVATVRDFVLHRISSVWQRYQLWHQYNPKAPPVLLDEAPLLEQLPGISGHAEQKEHAEHIVANSRYKNLMVDENGKKCCMIGARGLDIEHADKKAHWIWTSHDTGSRFPEVVKLLSVHWLDIQAKIRLKLLSPSTTYVIYLVFKVATVSSGLSYPAKATTIILDSNGGKTEGPKCKVYFSGDEHGNDTGESYSPEQRNDGWMEVHIGEFFVNQNDDQKLHVTLKEVNDRHEKKGLIIQGIEIRPKQDLRSEDMRTQDA